MHRYGGDVAEGEEIQQRPGRIRNAGKACRVGRLRPPVAETLAVKVKVGTGDPLAVGVGVGSAVNVEPGQRIDDSGAGLQPDFAEPDRSAPDVQEKLLTVGGDEVVRLVLSRV